MMILENLEKINLKIWKYAEEILTAFPDIVPNYKKGCHFNVTINGNDYNVFCTTSSGFRHIEYKHLFNNGYLFWTPNIPSDHPQTCLAKKTIIFDFSGRNPIWYYFEDRDKPFEYHEFPQNCTFPNKQAVAFLKNVNLASMCTSYNGGRKFLSSKGGKKRLGKPSNNKGRTNLRKNSIMVRLEIDTSSDKYDHRVVTLVEAYKILTAWGYKNNYQSLSKYIRRNGKYSIQGKNSDITIDIDTTAPGKYGQTTLEFAQNFNNSNDNSLGVPQLTLNNIYNIKGNLKEDNNINNNNFLNLTGVHPEATPMSNIQKFPENYKEVKTKKRQLKKSDKEYLEN